MINFRSGCETPDYEAMEEACECRKAIFIEMIKPKLEKCTNFTFPEYLERMMEGSSKAIMT